VTIICRCNKLIIRNPLQDYDVERDKTGRIVTPGTNNPRRVRERSRDRGVDLLDRDWDRRRESQSPQVASRHGNTYGLSQQFLETLGIDGQLVSKVFVSNVSPAL
jgi:hypothetical protein